MSHPVQYGALRTALLADPNKSADDNSAYGTLPNVTGRSMLINYTTQNASNPGGIQTPYFDNNGNLNNTNFLIPYANARALGLRAPAHDLPNGDAGIVFSNAHTWDFNPLDGITAGAFDFVGMATHEIGHALGMTSAVTNIDNATVGSPPPYISENGVNLTVVDLFRYSTQSIANGNGVPDICADTRDKYFSVDGGTTKIASYSTGVNKGDGAQPSHWKDNLALGIMDPSLALGETLVLTENDRRLFDVIGWQTTNTWNWINPAGGTYGNPAQWAAAIAPGAAQMAVFNLNSTYAVSVANSVTSNKLYLRNGVPTFNVASGQTLTTYDITVGEVAATPTTATFSGGALSVQVQSNPNLPAGTGKIIIGRSDGNSLSNLKLDGGINASTAAGVTVHPGSKLTMQGGNLSGGVVALSTGALLVSSGSSNSNMVAGVSGTGNIQVDGGTLTFNPPSNVSGFNIGTTSSNGLTTINAGTLKTQGTRANMTGNVTINTAAGGKLDINNGGLIIRASGAASLTNLKNLLIAGAGGAGFARATWDQPGINSSTAATDPLVRAVGYLDNDNYLFGRKTTFDGVTVPIGAILLKATLAGDTDLDLDVDDDDITVIATYYGQNNKHWFQGDFDFTGRVDDDDVTLIGITMNMPGAFEALTADGLAAGGLTAVPEPSGLALLGLAGAAALRRRRAH